MTYDSPLRSKAAIVIVLTVEGHDVSPAVYAELAKKVRAGAWRAFDRFPEPLSADEFRTTLDGAEVPE